VSTPAFPRACINGRFQILHSEHFEYFQRAAAKYGRLYIGLTGQARDLSGASRRAADAANPLSYWERTHMWRLALRAAGERADHIIGPFPIERPGCLPDFVPQSCICATTVRDEWNEDKVVRLRDAGYEVDVLYTDYNKTLSGARIREMIASGSSDWLPLVPPGVGEFLCDIDIASRLRTRRTSG
jgi:nicotinamide mononucleotide adenylyltransferase